MIKDIIILIIVSYIISRIFRFVIPIFRVTSAANDQMRKMQEQMKAMDQKMNQQRPPVQPAQSKRSASKDDYIDYEEVK